MDTSGRVMPVWPITLVSPWSPWKKRNLYTPRSAWIRSFNPGWIMVKSSQSLSRGSMYVLVRYSKETGGNAPRKIKGIVTIFTDLYMLNWFSLDSFQWIFLGGHFENGFWLCQKFFKHSFQMFAKHEREIQRSGVKNWALAVIQLYTVIKRTDSVCVLWRAKWYIILYALSGTLSRAADWVALAGELRREESD